MQFNFNFIKYLSNPLCQAQKSGLTTLNEYTPLYLNTSKYFVLNSSPIYPYIHEIEWFYSKLKPSYAKLLSFSLQHIIFTLEAYVQKFYALATKRKREKKFLSSDKKKFKSSFQKGVKLCKMILSFQRKRKYETSKALRNEMRVKEGIENNKI